VSREICGECDLPRRATTGPTRPPPDVVKFVSFTRARRRLHPFVAGAFALARPTSKDAVILITLPPGAYRAKLSGVSGDGGTAMVELYELP